ncbi:MAG: sugar transporter [Bacteroidetes bacterium]|nr:sugar transporter [Bacteroidota bacterium]
MLGIIGCVPNKKIIYLQDINQQADTLYDVQRNNYRLQKGDIVGIDVKLASDNPILQNIFEQRMNMNMSSALQQGGDYFYLTGFTIDDSGFVYLPIIGKMKLEGLNVFEANSIVQSTFNQYLSNVYTTVRLGGLRYSVLGEVKRPGKFMVLQNRMTLFEAIANAGDLTELAKRSEVTIMRQYPDGTRIHKVNLLDESIISSPYYYIQPNDIIYVQPLAIRALGTGTTGFQSLVSVLSVLSSTIIIVYYISKT